VKTGRGVRRMMFVTYLIPLLQECFTKEALEGFGDFKVGKQEICTV
jgi:hypothetical protein